MKTSARVSPISPSSRSSSLPGLPDERQALLVLVLARGLADEHQVGVGVARAEDHGVAGGDELRAAGAIPCLEVDVLERLPALLLRRRHDQSVDRGAAVGSAAKPQPAWFRACEGVILWAQQATGTPNRGLDPTSDARHDRHRGRRPPRPRPGLRAADGGSARPRVRGRGRRRRPALRPRRRDRRRRGGDRPGPAGRALLGRDGARRARPARGLRAASAHDRHARGRRLRGRRMRDRRLDAARPGPRPPAGRRAGHAGLRDRRRGPHRLPRRRVDGRQLPGHARVRGGAGGGHARASSASCSSRWCARRSSAGRSRATPR